MTLFSKIIRGEIPSYRITENDYFFAFLDINPLRKGHVLVIPKTETDKFFDLEEKFDIQIPFNANQASLYMETVGEILNAVGNPVRAKF